MSAGGFRSNGPQSGDQVTPAFHLWVFPPSRTGIYRDHADIIPAGSENRKVLPWPSVDSTQMRPP